MVTAGNVNIDLKFEPIRVSTLRGERPIPFNAYIKIGSRHVLYLRKGDSFEGDRLDRLKAKKLDRLYILATDRSKYDQYLQDNVNEAFDAHSKKDLLSRTSIIQGHLQAIAEELMDHPEIEENYTMALTSCQRFCEFMQNNDLALKCLLSFKNEEFSISHHGVNVASLTLALISHLQLADSFIPQLELLTLGALIHDIGRQQLELPSPLQKSKMTPEQKKLYESHPQLGIDRIREFSYFDEIVVNIIFQHEEFIDGSGYPQKLLERNTSPYSLMVSVANTYDKLITQEAKSMHEALKYMIIDSMGLHPLDMMKALQDALKKGHIIK
ncbi:MAG: HD domain-containing protein [Bdellovibrionales bacterium]|nr:HD domain-containing protein [Bdellovibrionales bacterium]